MFMNSEAFMNIAGMRPYSFLRAGFEGRFLWTGIAVPPSPLSMSENSKIMVVPISGEFR